MRIYRTDQMDAEPSPPDEERLEVLRELVDLLPDPQQLVVSLRFFGAAKTFGQIAEETGLTVYQVKGILDAGLVNLKQMLQGHPVGAVLAEHFSFVS